MKFKMNAILSSVIATFVVYIGGWITFGLIKSGFLSSICFGILFAAGTIFGLQTFYKITDRRKPIGWWMSVIYFFAIFMADLITPGLRIAFIVKVALAVALYIVVNKKMKLKRML